MAMSIIRKRLDEDYDALSLLDSLPSHDTFDWVPISSETRLAMKIGSVKGRDILALLVQLGDKPYEVRYWSLPHNRSATTGSHKVLSQDDVVRLSLYPPFKYNADISKSSKRKFSIIIKWYFMLKGLLHDGVGGDYNDYCKRFCDALRRIDAGRRIDDAEKNDPGDSIEGSQETPMTVDESSEPEDTRSPYKLRSGPHNEASNPLNSKADTTHPVQLVTPDDTPSTCDDDDETDYDKLCRYLDKHKLLYLLENIPKADGVQFVDQGFMPEAQPKKLFLGRHAKDDREIYAYMRPARGWHEINFWVEDPRRSLNITAMRSEDVAKQRILHPFNKTYPKDGPIDQGDRARLTLMVKFYFIAAGIARNFVLQETKAFPDRLRSALEYIAHRMGAAAAKPPVLEQTNTPARSASRRTDIDESHIQSSLALPRSPLQATTPAAARPTPVAARSTPVAAVTSPTTNTSTLPTHPSPRGTKRAAPTSTPTASNEDAHFASLAATLSQDQTLTKEINAVDHELEMKQMQKQIFMEKLERQKQVFEEKWNTEYDEIVTKRRGIEEQRGGVRKRFKRMSLKIAGGADEGVEDGE
ncbi:hypothetical protein FB567DRAFT_522174 [Paraphoma chrysanthemicola]|uniref:Uncharacterized protein n=1 Tax=Paraphoma chrysanthemicola TaxID=798071 RepID=A0A8K0R7F3_9PLEO|nr:hypothetical protein FB567DRAFT_522174 [Paraphoma chrysanthemicola]